MRIPLDELITLGTGTFVCQGGTDAVYKGLNYLTGDDLFTHQLARASDECRPYLQHDFPFLHSLDMDALHQLIESSDNGFAACLKWVNAEKTRLGLADSYEISPIPKDGHDVIDPILEAENLVGENRVFTVELPPME